MRPSSGPDRKTQEHDADCMGSGGSSSALLRRLASSGLLKSASSLQLSQVFSEAQPRRCVLGIALEKLPRPCPASPRHADTATGDDRHRFTMRWHVLPCGLRLHRSTSRQGGRRRRLGSGRRCSVGTSSWKWRTCRMPKTGFGRIVESGVFEWPWTSPHAKPISDTSFGQHRKFAEAAERSSGQCSPGSPMCHPCPKMRSECSGSMMSEMR